MKTVITNIKRASVEMILLSLLSEENKYGYQLSQEVKARSNGQFTLLEGSMYPILYRLTESGDVTFYEKKCGQRQVRLYYQITDSGKLRLKQLKETFLQQVLLIDSLVSFSSEVKDEQQS